jgi:hypothetical protein
MYRVSVQALNPSNNTHTGCCYEWDKEESCSAFQANATTHTVYDLCQSQRSVNNCEQAGFFGCPCGQACGSHGFTVKTENEEQPVQNVFNAASTDYETDYMTVLEAIKNRV